MTEEELIAHYPRLYHMAADGSWPSIQQNGLLSTRALLDRYGVKGERRRMLLTSRRPELTILAADGMPFATVRDNIPMSDKALSKCLQGGVTPAAWYELLNGFTFFWLSRARVSKLLEAKAYRSAAHVVLTVDTASLLRAHGDRILLSPMNSGSTIYKPLPRGEDTFRRVADYPFAQRRKTHGASAVVELVVEHGVPDIAAHTLAVHRIGPAGRAELWRAQTAAADEGP